MKKVMKKTKNVSMKGVSLNSLNTRQQNAMKRHHKHHTSGHIRHMVKSMNKGKTFTQAHKLAVKKVGK